MHKPTITQYDVEFPDDQEMSSRLARFLTREKVDVRSMVTTRIKGKKLVQFMAPKDATLRGRLERMGFYVREEQLFEVELPNHHWELHKLAKSLGDKGINILSLYSTIEGDNIKIVLAVDQPANAVALIEKLGFTPDYSVYD